MQNKSLSKQTVDAPAAISNVCFLTYISLKSLKNNPPTFNESLVKTAFYENVLLEILFPFWSVFVSSQSDKNCHFYINNYNFYNITKTMSQKYSHSSYCNTTMAM